MSQLENGCINLNIDFAKNRFKNLKTFS